MQTASDAHKSLGGKASSLMRLRTLGMPVPWFDVIGASHLQNALGLADCANLLEQLTQTDSSELTLQLCEQAVAVLSDCPLHAATLDWLERLPPGILIFRSSAALEDGAQQSMAGLLSSRVATADRREQALRSCWASLFSPSVWAYIDRLGSARDLRMGVIAQQWIEPRASGVTFSKFEGGSSLTEATFGRGETLVSGMITPDRYFEGGAPQIQAKRIVAVESPSRCFPADSISVTVNDRSVPAYVLEYNAEEACAYALLPEESALEPALKPGEPESLRALISRVEAHYGHAVDVEWVIDRSDHIWLVQARPCTTALHAPTRAMLSEPLKAQIASPGAIVQRAFVAHNADSIAQAPSGCILIAQATSPEHMGVLLRVGGVVVEQGGLLSHTAIVCRELGIPCLVGAEGMTQQFQTGQLLRLDADRGTLELESEAFQNPGKQEDAGHAVPFDGLAVLLQPSADGLAISDLAGKHIATFDPNRNELINAAQHSSCSVWTAEQPWPQSNYVLVTRPHEVVLVGDVNRG